MSTISSITSLPTLNPDTKICGLDGDVSAHFSLLIAHSRFLREMFITIPSNESDVVILVPDYPVREIESLVNIMYGLDRSRIVSGSLLKTLGFFELDTAKVEIIDGLMVIYEGPLEGFRLIDPTNKFFTSLPSTVNVNEDFTPPNQEK